MSSRRAAVCLAVAARRCPVVARAAAPCTGCSHRTGCRGTRHRDLGSQRAQRSSSCSAPHVDRVSQSCRTAAAERCRASLPAVRAALAAVHLMKYHAEQRRQQRWVLMPRTPAAAPLPPEPHPPQQRRRRVPEPTASQAATSRGTKPHSRVGGQRGDWLRCRHTAVSQPARSGPVLLMSSRQPVHCSGQETGTGGPVGL